MKVFLDIAIGGEKIGRIVCELFPDKAPKTVENFYKLCTGDGSDKTGDIALSYKNNSFHRVIRNFMIQGGDLVYGNVEQLDSVRVGLGGCSIYATEEEVNNEDAELKCFGLFADENLGEFTEPFMLAMANTGSADTNSSQFFITTYASPHLQGKHSIFGKVIHGKSVVRTVEYIKADKDGNPEQLVSIEDCGVWNDGMDIPLYNASNSTEGGDIYEEYPDDDNHFGSEDFAGAYEAATIIKDSGTLLFKKKDFKNAFFKYLKALNYTNEYIPELDVDEKHNLLFTDLKKKLYLNLCLVLFNMKEYENSIKYADYLIEMDKVDKKDLAKAYYRKGNCLYAKNRFEDALDNYRLCKENNPEDVVIDKKIETVERILEEKKEKTKRSIAKFFS